MENNIFDTALIFEGGGMRASYTCAVANALLENELFFDNVYGVSAGSSNAVNYVCRDKARTKYSFVGFASAPRFGGIDTFLAHKGYFNAQYIYEESCKPGEMLSFCFTDFMENPAKLTISGFRRDTGETVYWTRNDLDSLGKLMRRVRASSTLPIVMPAPNIDGYYYYDGGLGEGAGLMTDKAMRDGFEKLLVIRTQPKEYRKQEVNSPISSLFWKRPYVQRALNSRAQRYNDECDKLEQLEREGKAYVFYAQNVTAKSSTTDVPTLEKNYSLGKAQIQEEMPAIKKFLGI